VHDHEVVTPPSDREEVAQEAGGDDGRLVRSRRSKQRRRSRNVLDRESLDLLAIKAAACVNEVVDGALRLHAEGEADITELEVEVDDERFRAGIRESDGEV